MPVPTNRFVSNIPENTILEPDVDLPDSLEPIGMKAKPNLLFILSDSHRFDTMSAYGNHSIRVPNLNRLAEGSAVFQRAYCSVPVCKPARSSLLTGMYPQNSRVLSNRQNLSESVPTLVDHVHDPDYRNGYIGLWSVSGEIKPRPGFDRWVSTIDGYSEVDGGNHVVQWSNYSRFLLDNGFEPDDTKKDQPKFSKMFCKQVPEAYSKPAYLASEATRFIEQNKDRSFILFVSFKEPHPPYFSSFDDMYDPAEVELPPTFNTELGEDTPLKCRLNRLYYQKGTPTSGEPLEDEAAWRRMIARYWGQISLVDKYTGNVLKCLEDNGLDRDTIVVYTSDHGEVLGDFRMLGKCMMPESAVRVPLLIRIPGTTDDQVMIEPPVGTIDLTPTLLDALGHGKGHLVPEGLDGKSLYPTICGKRTLDNNNVFIQWNGSVAEQGFFPAQRNEQSKQEIDRVHGADVRTVVTADGWKLSLSTAGEHELYHLRIDPWETKNLYFTAGHDRMIQNLTKRITQWQQATGDHVSQTWP